MLREFALITFTILAQMSVGAFLVLGLVSFIVARKAGQMEADRMVNRSFVAIIIMLGLGLLASLFHLGSPLSAPRAITNFGTSWLSREIVFGIAFAVLSTLFLVLQWFKIGSVALRNLVVLLGALVGIVFIYAMSKIYMLPTQPAWNTLATPISFFTTALLLGSLAMGAAFIPNYAFLKKKDPGCAELQCDLMRSTLRWIALAALILLGVEYVVTPVYLVSLASGSPQAVESVRLMAGELGLPFLLRMILAFVGAGVFGFFLYQNAQSAGREKVLGYMVYAAFVLVLAAEVFGRFLFYSSQVAVTL